MGNSRGTALWESLPVISVLFVIISGSLLVVYLSLGKSWLLYQAEQGLYCISEEKPSTSCAKMFTLKGQAFLPWGELKVHQLARTPTGAEIDAEWKIAGFYLKIRRSLDLRSSVSSRSFL